MAPLSATGVGVSWSLQGLWAAPGLRDVTGLERSAVVDHLTLMAAVLSASALLLGVLAERLRRAGVSTELFLVGTLALSMAAQLALLLGFPVSSYLLFAVIAAAGATTVLSFALLARYFPNEAVGRANAALGVLNIGTAFVLQCISGLIIAQWPAERGHYPAQAHEAAMAAGLAARTLRRGYGSSGPTMARRLTLAADKAYDRAPSSPDFRAMCVTPHVAQNTKGRSSDGTAACTCRPRGSH